MYHATYHCWAEYHVPVTSPRGESVFIKKKSHGGKQKSSLCQPPGAEVHILLTIASWYQLLKKTWHSQALDGATLLLREERDRAKSASIMSISPPLLVGLHTHSSSAPVEGSLSPACGRQRQQWGRSATTRCTHFKQNKRVHVKYEIGKVFPHMAIRPAQLWGLYLWARKCSGLILMQSSECRKTVLSLQSSWKRFG